MGKMASGLSENPGEVSSLQSRMVCQKCWQEPSIKKANFDPNSGMITATVSCHGQEETQTSTKQKLINLWKFFQKEEESEPE